VRVVVVSAWEPWRTTDGAAFVLDHQLRQLAPRHDITLLAAGKPAATSATNFSVASHLDGVDVQWFGSRTGPAADHVARRLWSLRHREPAHVRYVERPDLIAALRAAVSAGVDLVHLHGWGTAALWREVGQIPTVHVAIDPWSANNANRRLSRARRLVNSDQPALIARHERAHYPHLGAVVVVTEQDAELVRDVAPGARVEVVPNGVDAGPDPAPYPQRPVLGFHGVFDSQANVDAAVSLVTEVLPLVRRTVPDAEVLLVGRRPPKEIKTLVAQGVALHADVDDIRNELAAMAVHVDWMTSGAGIKNKVLEAMAAARPVVASPRAAAGIGEGPGLLVADTVQNAAETIVGLLGNAAAAADTGAAGRDRVVAEFSWASNAQRIEALWARLAR
jgi:glycosyltransferase involved in cell wall biosynthesis